MNSKIRNTAAISAAMMFAFHLSACGIVTEIPEETEPSVETLSYAIPSVGVGRDDITSEETELSVERMPQVICIDPGHGFDDGGTHSDYMGELNEDDITIAVALMLEEELNSLGYETVLTHNGQEFPVTSAYDNNNKYRPAERTAFANSVDIDYYVSIHCNSHTNPEAQGTRIYYYDGYIKEEHTSDVLAEAINSGVLRYMEPGWISSTIEMTAENVFQVLRETTVPASLVEMGFVTNEYDASKMLDEAWQREFARGIAFGIDSYYRANKN